MNDKYLNSILLLAILATLLAVAAEKFFPDKRLTVWPNTHYSNYFYSTAIVNGHDAAYWLDQQNAIWRCDYPRDDKSEYFACSFNVLFGSEFDQGVDLSDYDQLKIKLRFQGTSSRIRFYLRNYNPAYSNKDDNNSTKFQSLILHTKDLHQEISIKLDEFVVADWWLGQYDMPRDLARPELTNIVSLGMDYIEGMQPGPQDIQLEKIEFIGGWISTANWYLLILASWMLGIFIFAVTRLIQLRQQTKHDVQVINQLNSTNEQLQQEKDKFRRLSTVDPLTQIYNRFGIDQVVSALLDGNIDSHKTETRCSLIVVDIDYFKRINDRRGHDVGDQVLQTITGIISKGIRSQDFIGRWGGEEFIVILPDTTKEFALALAEKIRLMICDFEFEPDNPLRVTASFGISAIDTDEDFATAFKRADTALYAAKAQGRNCCVMGDQYLAI